MWMGDNLFNQNGVTRVVQSSKSISHVMDTLRVFTTRKKNCYSIKADKGEKVLVRASFFYGNYDNKASPPSFDLQLDGNDWATVQTSSDELVYYEVIYVVKGETTSVCVAQTKPNQFPFMSALEIHSLDSLMYSHVDSNFALYLSTRVAYGTNETIRNPDDIYDRIWVPGVVGNGLTKVTSDALFISNNVADNPPQAVLQNAITTSTNSGYIILSPGVSSGVVPIYVNMYFSEVTELDSTQKRSFKVYKDNQSFSEPIIPPYGNVSEMYVSNITVSSNTTFSLVATSDSTLPPLINAMEIFYISDALTDGTNSNDVEGLSSLQTQFGVLQEWGSDPCLPASFTWEWVNCSTDATPRVTALDLSSFGLLGLLPDFSSMDAIETIDLHNNSLVGAIPDFLGAFPNLKELVTGNPDLCASGKSCPSTSYSGSKKKKNKLPVILGTTIPSFLVVWAIAGVLAILRQKRKKASVAAVGAGQTGGANGPNGMAGKIGEAVMDEFKVYVEEQVNVEMADQVNQQVQQGQYDGRNTS
ncbi:hypothetical protein RJ639_043184 [Escallonia herrerae]|uniref:Malectin-like domain-containing protein n=1 Tax=Escallonia herrerae TaxID=1293975 RepID=A0AA89B3L7_9ASTE|nr:hypothetical protein RJ639_043184 [Escallonia herrerae]